MQNVFTQIASRIVAMRNCEKVGNTEWRNKHKTAIESLVKEHAPSGSGFDNGTRFDYDKSTGAKLIFHTSFHHMNETGYYDGWTEHTVTVTRDFLGACYRVSGRNRNDIKEFIEQAFSAMDVEAEEEEV